MRTLKVLLIAAAVVAALTTGYFIGAAQSDPLPGSEEDPLISKSYVTITGETAVVARGDDPADALAAAPLAEQLNAVVLLTDRDRLPGSTREALEEIGAQKVYVMGGTAAVSESVEDDLKKLGYQVERIYGSNRYDTARQIASYIIDNN